MTNGFSESARPYSAGTEPAEDRQRADFKAERIEMAGNENVQTALFEILKAIQAELADHRRRFDAIDRHFDEMRDLVRKQRRDTAGLLVMAKATTGQFAEELAAIAERVSALEAAGRA